MYTYRQLAEGVINSEIYMEHFASASIGRSFTLPSIYCRISAIISHAELAYGSIYESVIEGKVKLRPIEADAMYAGIVIDTDNFLTKTGVRTLPD